MLTVGSLFAGIGGFDLGFERAGMRTVWQVEQSEFCRRVLERHFPDAERFEDVRHVGAADLARVDLVCGGFPCQDISLAGKGAGIEGERSGLWGEYARLVGELRPRYVVVENVSALLGRGLDRVLGDLATLGYDAEWDCLPAAAFGAPHRRDRLWIVAYPRGVEHQGSSDAERRASAQGLPSPDADGSGRLTGQPDVQAREPDAEGCSPDLADAHRRRGAGRQESPGGGRAGADANSGRCEVIEELDGRPHKPGEPAPQRNDADRLRDPLADADELGCEEGLQQPAGGSERPGQGDAERSRPHGFQDADSSALQPWRVGGRIAQAGGPEWWAAEPPVGRVAHGVPDRLDQLAALGNALVPQIAEWIGRRIIEYEQEAKAA